MVPVNFPTATANLNPELLHHSLFWRKRTWKQETTCHLFVCGPHIVLDWPAMVWAYKRLPKVKTCNSYSLAIFSKKSLQWGRRRVCSIGSPRPSWKWKMPCGEQARVRRGPGRTAQLASKTLQGSADIQARGGSVQGTWDPDTAGVRHGKVHNDECH